MPDPSAESHHLLPSGEWEGFYLYPGNSHRHDMKLVLHFRQGQLDGSGWDDIGSFFFAGNYDTGVMQASWVKRYSTHEIGYSGHIDENGIWGHWHSDVLGAGSSGWGLKGGFHIWPVKRAGESAVRAEEEVTEKQLSLKN